MNMNGLFVLAVVAGGLVMLAGVLLSMFVFSDSSGQPNLVVLLVGLVVGTLIEIAGFVALVMRRRGH